jgi:hypothetical protein
MTKPDDTRWTPEEEAQVDKRRDAIVGKLLAVIRQDNPRTEAAWNAVVQALCDVILSVVMSMSTDPRKMMDIVASQLKQSVHARLGGRETEH